MLVRNLMTHPVITVSEDATVGEALELMKRKNIRHLPVVNANRQLLGITSEVTLLRVFPKSKTISTFENNLLARTPVSAVMSTGPVTAFAGDLVEQAALMMRDHKVTCLPVMEGPTIVGMISRTDIINAFISSFGFGELGTRITIAYKKKWGFLSNLINFMDKYGIVIDHIVTFDNEIVVKIRELNPEEFISELKKAGYQVTDVVHIDLLQEQQIYP